MKRALLFLSLLLQIPSIAVGADRMEKVFPTADGRFGTGCSSTGFTDGPVCFVPFVRLITSPERYDGKIIAVTGFLTNFLGYTTLFPTRESWESGAVDENIYLGGELPRDLRPKLNQGVWVRVVGKFDGKYSGPAMSLGAIWHVIAIDPSQLSKPEYQPPNVKMIKPTVPKAVSPKLN